MKTVTPSATPALARQTLTGRSPELMDQAAWTVLAISSRSRAAEGDDTHLWVYECIHACVRTYVHLLRVVEVGTPENQKDVECAISAKPLQSEQLNTTKMRFRR